MSRIDVKNNKLSQTRWLLSILIISLLLLSLLPEVTIGTFHLKKMDILSDLHPDLLEESMNKPDTVSIGQTPADSLAPTNGPIFQIEDYSSDGRILKDFYNALLNADNRPVRIAFFGDSFIEGDIVSASLRDTLQNIFGGNGVGWVPLATETAGFRKSIKHTYSHWDTYSLLAMPETTLPIGISGYTYLPKKNNIAVYKPGKVPLQENFKVVKIYYQNKGSSGIHYTINTEPEVSQAFDKSDSIKQFMITHSGIESIQLRMTPADGLFLFGISFENTQGIYVDNFSMRRNSGIALSKLSPHLLKQFNHYLDYKLIILQYGLNVASDTDSTNYGWYTGKMIKIINDLKEVFPETSFLLLSVSDRGINKNGKIVTMDAVQKMRNMQRDIAKKSGIAFWDTFEAMGGRNSIVTYTESQPPLAAKDYTHLTHLGGNKIGRKLADALLHHIIKREKKTNTH